MNLLQGHLLLPFQGHPLQKDPLCYRLLWKLPYLLVLFNRLLTHIDILHSLLDLLLQNLFMPNSFSFFCLSQDPLHGFF
jgi:hypothetical protein